jgi:hypothetical protein
VESNYRVQLNAPSKEIDLSEAHLFFCLGHDTARCECGWWPPHALDEFKRTGYWICKNSWNPTFDENGFFRIAYGQCGIETWNNCGVIGIG